MIPSAVYHLTYYLGSPKTNWNGIKKEFDLSDSEIKYLKDEATRNYKQKKSDSKKMRTQPKQPEKKTNTLF